MESKETQAELLEVKMQPGVVSSDAIKLNARLSTDPQNTKDRNVLGCSSNPVKANSLVFLSCEQSRHVLISSICSLL